MSCLSTALRGDPAAYQDMKERHTELNSSYWDAFDATNAIRLRLYKQAKEREQPKSMVENEVVNTGLDRTAVEGRLLAAYQDDSLEQTPKQFQVPTRRFLFQLCENHEITSVEGHLEHCDECTFILPELRQFVFVVGKISEMPDSDFLCAVSVQVAVAEVLHVEDPLDRPACPSVFGTSFLVSITTTSEPPLPCIRRWSLLLCKTPSCNLHL